MKNRDDTRAQIKKASSSEKLILLAKNKKLRNLINCGIRKETIAQNEKRVQSAKSDSKNYFPVYR